VVDLGTGTGSNVRYLAPRIAAPQEWLVIDEDAALLDAMPACLRAWAEQRSLRTIDVEDGLAVTGADLTFRVRMRRANLSTLWSEPDALDPFFGRSLVTASALLDLVSPVWADRLADACRRAGAAVLFALTYDGRIICTPELPGDTRIRDLVNAHQRTDKGFGPALGPSATAHVEAELVRRGYCTRTAASDWVIEADHAALQRALIEGWAAAALEMDQRAADHIAVWRRQRLALVEAARSTLIVGHQDLAGWIPRSLPTDRRFVAD
jgi:hypothetical protein